MSLIIDEIEKFGNGKVVGTIPLIPFLFARPILDLYLSHDIRAFAIDANYKDIIGNVGDFTLILSKINGQISRLGIPSSSSKSIRYSTFSMEKLQT